VFEIHKRGGISKNCTALSFSHSTSTATAMSATGAIPLNSIPPRVNSPRRLPDTSSSATSRIAVTSPQSPNGSQAVRQMQQVTPTDSKGKTLCTKLHVCASWIRSHPLLSISGLNIALVTLFLGYYQARAANILTSEGNRLAGTALDYTRYQTWCQNLDVGCPKSV
jgi:hypothetical protein